MPETLPTPGQLEEAIRRLQLTPDGEPFTSLTSRLCPVILQGRRAMLKVTDEPEEQAGCDALVQWDGAGAVRVLARDGNAAVLERAGVTLRSSRADDAAVTRVLCAVAQRLHRHPVAGAFQTLPDRFAALLREDGPEFDQARVIARDLLAQDTAPVLLHGDIHAENVLDGGERGWLAIDPKGVIGPREFDYCNLFTNWTLGEAVREFDARLEIVTSAARIPPDRLLRWIVAWSALSGIWCLADGDAEGASFPHAIMAQALARL